MVAMDLPPDKPHKLYQKIANAVADATGVRCRDLPLAPDRVFRALAAHRGGSAG